jgi:hypothetical protein
LCLPAVLLLGGGLAVHAQQSSPRQSQPILFSEPKGVTVSSNLNLIATKKAPLRNLEDDLKKPFEPFELFDAANSLSGAPALPQRLPPPPQLNNRRARELLQKREEEWLFETPQGRDEALIKDDWLKTSESDLPGEGSRKQTSLERYYDRLERARVASTNQVRSSDPFNLQKDRELGEALNLQPAGNPLGVNNPVMEQLFKQLAQPNNRSLFGNNDDEKTAGKLFDLGKVESSSAQLLQAQEARREKYKELLETRTSTTSGSSAALKPFGDTTTPVFTTANVLVATPTTSPADGNVLFNFVGKPAVPQELPPAAPALPSLTPTPPTEQPLKNEKPHPVSTFSLPRRSF